MKNLLLIRHAETDNAGRLCGHTDPELNQRGRQQLAGLVERLSEYTVERTLGRTLERTIDRIYTSDLRRASQTAEAIASHFGLKFDARAGLREMYFGLWEDLSWSEIEASDPARAKQWADEYPNVTAPGGESMQHFERRVRAENALLCTTATETYTAVVTHAGFIRCMLTKFHGMPEEEAWRLTKEYGSVVALDSNLMQP